MSNKIRKVAILDPGHGGVNPITCQYETAPKKMFDHKNSNWAFHEGTTFYEGVFNREVVKCLMKKLSEAAIPYICTLPAYPFSKDVSLRERVEVANQLDENFETIFISFHANAFNGTARGYEVHYDFSDEQSHVLGDCIARETKIKFAEKSKSFYFKDGDVELNGLKFRSNKDSPNFYVIRKTKMPSVLIEHGFFDNIDDAKLLVRHDNIELFASAVFETIKAWNNGDLKLTYES